MKKGMGSHQSATSVTDEWYSPPEVVSCLGTFDLDPCTTNRRPWDTAKHHYTREEDGLLLPWFGRVWMNPPYGNAITPWLEKMALHANGIALTFARTDRTDFHDFVFGTADSILFVKQRFSFYNHLGEKAPANGGAPNILFAYGESNVEALEESGIKGKHLLLNSVPMIIVSSSPSWKNVVKISLIRLGNQASLKAIYDLVEIVAPDKVDKNLHYKEKVRQVLQKHFRRIATGKYSMNETIELNAD